MLWGRPYLRALPVWNHFTLNSRSMVFNHGCDNSGLLCPALLTVPGAMGRVRLLFIHSYMTEKPSGREGVCQTAHLTLSGPRPLFSDSIRPARPKSTTLGVQQIPSEQRWLQGSTSSLVLPFAEFCPEGSLLSYHIFHDLPKVFNGRQESLVQIC